MAAAQYISVRYLHKLFEAEETTVAEWIRSRRLFRAAYGVPPAEYRLRG